MKFRSSNLIENNYFFIIEIYEIEKNSYFLVKELVKKYSYLGKKIKISSISLILYSNDRQIENFLFNLIVVIKFQVPSLTNFFN